MKCRIEQIKKSIDKNGDNIVKFSPGNTFFVFVKKKKEKDDEPIYVLFTCVLA